LNYNKEERRAAFLIGVGLAMYFAGGPLLNTVVSIAG